MIDFNVILAEIPITVHSIYNSTKEFMVDYLTDKSGVFDVTVSEKDIEFEKEKSKQTNISEGKAIISYPSEYLETLSIYRKIAKKMPFYDVFLMHGAAICVDGEGYLFTARSGVGKTTHIRNWLKKFGDRADIVNGDKPLIKVTDDGVYVFGTPWQGKENFGSNISAPLKRICIVTRNSENKIEKVKYSQEITTILPQIYKSQDSDSYLKTMQLFQKLSKIVPLYKLGCTMDVQSAEVAYNGMK